MELVELIVAVHERFERADIRHAFGGALALGYIATPRGTVDVDVNVFLGVDELDRVDVALEPIELRRTDGSPQAVPVAGVRYRSASDPFPVDVFPSLDPRYDEIERRCVRHPFGPHHHELPFLSAEDLCVFKLSFGREQDWVDLRAVVGARPDLVVEYIERQLIGLRGNTMHTRVARLRAMFRR